MLILDVLNIIFAQLNSSDYRYYNDLFLNFIC